jgi:serine/threonine protein phosphatase PrpC
LILVISYYNVFCFYCAVGDSRCILIRRGTRSLEAHLSKLSLADETTTEGINTSKSSDFFVKEMSYDHKPDVPGEKQRIEAAGLTVEETRFVENGEEHVIAKVVRETSKMSCSRSFGDREYKENEDLDAAHQAVTAVPGIIVHERTHQDAFLVLACDGIFDVMTNEEVGAFVATSVQEGLAKEEEYVLPKVADRLLRECLDRGSSDNMSCIIVALSDLADKVSPQQIIPKSLNFSPTESTPLPK